MSTQKDISLHDNCLKDKLQMDGNWLARVTDRPG